MEIEDLALPARFIEHFAGEGIEELYPPQAGAVEAGITAGANVLAAVPTAGGKTLIAQLAMLSAPGKALYVVPLRALAAEKGEAFAELPGVSVGVATGDYETTAEELAEHDVLVATSEKVDSLIRNEAPWLSELGCVVVDEVHLLNDRGRGPTLEMTIAKLRELLDDPQLVALSATVANPGAIADWLDADLLTSEWRPVDLRRGVHHDGRIVFADDGEDREVAVAGPGAGSTTGLNADEPRFSSAGEPTPSGGADQEGTDDPTRALIRDALGEGGQCLAFVHSRRAAESLARAFAAEWFGTAGDAAAEIRETARTDTGEALAACVKSGVAFHHAGLRPAHRSLVEAAFRDREIDAVCATPTLAAGVNIPARRVIVRDHWRYTDDGRTPLPVLEVHQMFGRAGRPDLDPYGEAVLIAEDEPEARELRERYIEGDPEAVTSKLASQDALRTHVLATIANGFAGSRGELLDVLEGTFYAAEEDHAVLVDIADLVLDYLADVDMIERKDGLDATDLGEQVSRLYVDPETGAEFVAAFEAAEDREPVTRLTVLELVCDTAEVGSFYLRGEDRARAYTFAERHEGEFLTSIAGFEGNFDAWLATLKTVRVLADWLDGVEEGAITDRHGIGPGDLRMKVERAEWLVGAAESLADLLDSPLAERIGAVREAFEAREP
ncbi:MAG: DEAD/DEAH box helicase [Halobacteriales archaeon]